MEKYKLLGKNIGLLTISSFGTKLLSFFLVPLYTNVLTTTEYGIYDLLAATVSLLLPILTVNIQDAVLRFTLEATEDRKEKILRYGLRMIGVADLVVCLIVFLIAGFALIPVIAGYPVYFILLFASTSLYQLFSNYARGMDRINDVSVAGVISAVAGIVLNIILLVFVKLGLEGYFIAAIASSLLPAVYLAARFRVWRSLSAGKLDASFRREMLLYSAPLILNAIGWWINNTSDRYVVTGLCGIAANGIYSVGYKIPSILDTCQTIFNKAWVLSSVKEYDPEDKDGFFGRTYSVYNSLLVLLCALVILMTKPLASLLYAKEFYTAWQYVPFLTIAIVFGALSGFMGGVFAAAKDSKLFGASTLVGAGVNLALDIALVYVMGPIGAAIATAVSYIVVWVIRYRGLKKHIVMRINLLRDIAGYALLFVLTGLLFVRNMLLGAVLPVAVLGMIVVLYRKEIAFLVTRIPVIIRRRPAR